jgi:DNA polymerase III epsilon subunit-like protein
LLNTTAQSQSRAAEYARQLIAQEPVFLDTETTGLGKDSDIVEFSLIDKDGNLLFDSLVRPSRPIPMEVIRIHHINDQMVSSAPSWPAVWARVRHLLIGRKIGIYNAEFDLRMMQQSMEVYRLSWRENLRPASFCIMDLYSQYCGAWDPMKRGMRRFSLEHAGQAFQISLPNSHRAKDDSLLARAVLHSIAGLPY